MFKKGFNLQKFEADHFTFKRGSAEKYFHGWEDVRYEGGLSPRQVRRYDLEDGNMSQPLYDFLAHVYGEDAMAQYFPAPEPAPVRKPTLRFDMGSIMANGVGRQPMQKPQAAPQPKKNMMSEEELDDLAIRLFGSINDVNQLNARKHK